MRKQIDDTGGPAFPEPERFREGCYTEDQGYRREGMSLRDGFAGQALQGEMASQASDGMGHVWKEERYGTLARIMYALADAMLEARKN